MEEAYKRFLLFGYDNFYPEGGVDDVIGSFDSKDEAKAHADETDFQHFDLLDLQERKWVDMAV